MTAFRCPHCGGYISFDPSSQQVKCSYCESLLTVEEIDAGLDSIGYYRANEQVCPQCGAAVLSTDNTVATFCSYCGSSVVLSSRICAEKKPDAIIPFSISKNKCLEIWQQKLDKTLLAPNWMKEEELTSRFRGIYMPFYVYEYRTEGTWQGTASYTTLEGKYDVTRTYSLTAEPNAKIGSLAVDASAAFPDTMSRGVSPFNDNKEDKFSPAYLSGYYADAGDVDPEVYSSRFKELSEAHLENTDFRMTRSRGREYKPLEVPGREIMKDMELTENVRKVFYPVWLLNMRRNDKVSYAAINGESGKIAVDLPMDFGKFLMVCTTVAAALYLLLNLFFTFTPGALAIISTLFSVIALFTADNQLNRLYRREHHYDDTGLLSLEEPEKAEKAVKVTKRHPMRARGKAARVLGIIGSILLFFLSAFLCLFVSVLLDNDTFPGMAFFLPTFSIVLLGIFISSLRTAKLKVKKAPLYWKFLILLQPFMGMAANFYVFYKDPVSDDWYYLSVIFSILMIILCYFEIVLMQNKETQRDIPVFTGKRGETSER